MERIFGKASKQILALLLTIPFFTACGGSAIRVTADINSGTSAGNAGSGGTGSAGSGAGGSGASAPTSLSYGTLNATYGQNVAISNNTPTVAGGTPTTYSVSPALPAGLSLDTSTGVISGTPTGVQAITSHTVTATNSAGSVNHNIRIAVVAVPDPNTGTAAGGADYWYGAYFNNGTDGTVGGDKTYNGYIGATPYGDTGWDVEYAIDDGSGLATPVVVDRTTTAGTYGGGLSQGNMSGKSTSNPTGSGASSPIGSVTGGFFFIGNSGASGPTLPMATMAYTSTFNIESNSPSSSVVKFNEWATNKPSGSLASVDNTQIKRIWLIANNNDTDTTRVQVRPALKIGNQWFVTVATFTGVSGPGNQLDITLNGGAQWYPIHFIPGTALTTSLSGLNAQVLPSGTMTAVGAYITYNSSTTAYRVRLDDFILVVNQ